MKLIIENTRCVLTDLTKDERTDIKNILSMKDPRTGFTRGQFNKEKVKTEKFYYENKAGILFFTGLLKDIMPVVKDRVTSVENNIKTFKYQRDYTYDELRPFFNPKFEHVEHQVRALQQMLKRSKGVIKAPTSSGKTEIIIAFLKLTKVRTVVIGPKVDLCNQLFERIKKAGIDAGLMTGSKKAYNNELVCVATPQMAAALVDRDFECIICDECHHVASKTYQDIMKSTKAKIIFGFSATPDTNKVDWMKVKQFCGPIIEEIKTTELLEHNVIVYPEIKFIPIFQTPTQDWESANDICIMHNSERNDKITELCENNPKPALVLIRNIEHGEDLNSKIPNSFFLSGRDSTDTRNDILKKFENKELDVLIGTYQVLGEGISVNAIRTLIIAMGGKSDVATTQALGRALRRDGDDKTIANVYDFMDVGNKFCEKHSLQRAKIYKDVGFPVNLEKPEKIKVN